MPVSEFEPGTGRFNLVPKYEEKGLQIIISFRAVISSGKFGNLPA
jgi:hypothetical protein